MQSSQAKQIRKKMSEIMIREAENCDLKDLVAKFIPESIGREIEKACQVCAIACHVPLSAASTDTHTPLRYSILRALCVLCMPQQHGPVQPANMLGI